MKIYNFSFINLLHCMFMTKYKQIMVLPDLFDHNLYEHRTNHSISVHSSSLPSYLIICYQRDFDQICPLFKKFRCLASVFCWKWLKMTNFHLLLSKMSPLKSMHQIQTCHNAATCIIYNKSCHVEEVLHKNLTFYFFIFPYIACLW